MKTILLILVTVTALAARLAQAATGDLDPSFGDHGRISSIGNASGQALFVEALASGGVLVGGAGRGTFRFNVDCYRYYGGSSFAGQLVADGSIDPAFTPALVPDIAAVAMARLPNGRIIGFGRKFLPPCGMPSKPVVFRLESNGSLDLGFGVNGIRELSNGMLPGALVLDPDGRIAIAGVRWVDDDDPSTSDYKLTILRLRPNGALDTTFATNGAYIGPAAHSSSGVRLARVAAGGYRASLQATSGCRIVGITVTGTRDASFGNAGVVSLGGPGGTKVSCEALELAPDGSTLVGGAAGKHGFVTRLRPSGAVDNAFAPDSTVSESMTRVTAVAFANDGKLLIAGIGSSGTSILRLDASGALDTAFGDAGRTWIDLDKTYRAQPSVRDMSIAADGGVVAAGANSNQPFVVRLLGDGGGTSAGVLGFSTFRDEAFPGGQAILRVRRSGGRDGAVSVGYRTVARGTAQENEDFVPESGRRRWAAGDSSEKLISIDIAPTGAVPEGREYFQVVLGDARGDAGLGERNARVNIEPDGAPGGQFQLHNPNGDAYESRSTHQVYLSRNYYSAGRVCVTLKAAAGTATAGVDFTVNPTRHCWDDQDQGGKSAEIQIVNDNLREGDERFVLMLVSPTGGAIVGPFGRQAVKLRDND